MDCLTLDEQHELMDLLGLERTLYGCYGLMKTAFKSAALKYHPDKGGDPALMQRLNVLFGKLVEAMQHAPSYKPDDEVKIKLFQASPDTFYCKTWGSCNLGLSSSCLCLMCLLRHCHKKRQNKESKPLLWMRCFCFTCFLTWFGVENNWSSCNVWMDMVANTSLDELKLW
ncbi:small T antigen [Zetapolyomavirus delphini]|uniref:Small T antigen n=1 Tax=Zetapolyomavirus delphini TaxID=1891756 RepID=S5MND0_9POLY|nr:small T antigen [Zetapolyomavirus delphini]AGR44743.1 small T antigen [Zetapolyomavirus delphini]